MSAGSARWLGACGLILTLASTACQRTAKTRERQAASLFARSCGGCHGVDGRGGLALGYKTPPRNLTDPKLFAELGESGLRAVIKNGKGQMPAFGRALSDQDVDLLVEHVRSLSAGSRGTQPAAATSAPNTSTR